MCAAQLRRAVVRCVLPMNVRVQSTACVALLVVAAPAWKSTERTPAYFSPFQVRVEALEARLGAGGEVPSGNGGQAQQQAGLAVGSEAPGFTLAGLHGDTLTLESLRSSDKPVIR
jgi:hypothetical protein